MSDLGELLKRTRQEKNKSLEEIQQQTKIQLRYLEAIEQGDFDVLPGHFYVRAFVKSYAEALGLDPDYIFREYESDLPEQSQSDTVKPIRRRRRTSKASQRSWRWLSPFLLFSFIVLILFTIYFAISNYQFTGPEPENPDQEENVPGSNLPEVEDGTDEPEPPVEEQPEEEPTPEPEPEPEPEPSPQLAFITKSGNEYQYELTDAESIQLSISAARGNCWVQVRNSKNGRVLYEKVMNTGDSKSFDIKDTGEAFIGLGNGAVLDITVNDQALDTSSFRAAREDIWIQVNNNQP